MTSSDFRSLLAIGLERLDRLAIISAMATLLANGVDRQAVCDAELLPFPKDLILRTCFSELVVSTDERERTFLVHALYALTRFQPNIGPEPHYRWGVANFLKLSPEQMLSIAETLPEKDIVWERHENESEKLSRLLEAFFEWEKAR